MDAVRPQIDRIGLRHLAAGVLIARAADLISDRSEG